MRINEHQRVISLTIGYPSPIPEAPVW